jgi:4-alpha-glucanotransferase
MLTEVLRHHGIDNHDIYAVASFLARTKSRLLAISIEDLLGVTDQPNIPGTVNQHPNWRRRLPLAIDEMMTAIDVPALKTATRERTRAAI